MVTVEDPTGKAGPYGYLGNTWASWDSIDQVVAKVKYAMSKGLGGIQFWELSLDDFNGHCNLGLRYSKISLLILIVNRFNSHVPFT